MKLRSNPLQPHSSVGLKRVSVIICAAALFGATCQSRTMPPPRPMDQSFLHDLYKAEPGQVVTINSGGGHPAIGEAAARYIRDNKLSVKLEFICFSSCAEYILPAAEKVDVTRNTLIGFHQSPLLIRHLADEAGYEDYPNCDFEDQMAYLRELHPASDNGQRPWEIVLGKLQVSRTQFVQKPNCVRVGFNFVNAMWFPTSEQIEQLFGITFDQPICADDFRCARRMIDRLSPNAESVVIGDEVYVSK